MKTTIIEVQKSTLERFQLAKMIYQAKHQKKITNDEFIKILVENIKGHDAKIQKIVADFIADVTGTSVGQKANVKHAGEDTLPDIAECACCYTTRGFDYTENEEREK